MKGKWEQMKTSNFALSEGSKGRAKYKIEHENSNNESTDDEILADESSEIEGILCSNCLAKMLPLPYQVSILNLVRKERKQIGRECYATRMAGSVKDKNTILSFYLGVCNTFLRRFKALAREGEQRF